MAELIVEHLAGYALASVMARKGVVPTTIGAALRREMPIGARWTGDAKLALLGTGPGTWLAIGEHGAPTWSIELAQRLRGLASVSDQTGGYTVTRLSGPDARRLLQRSAAIDLYGPRCGPGFVAATALGQIGAIVRQLDDCPTYDVATFRSYSDSFRHWLNVTSASL